MRRPLGQISDDAAAADIGGYRVHAVGLARRYATQDALAGVDVDVEAGELVALTGPSGSGKSTLLNLIGAMDTATGGTLVVGGRDLTRLTATERAEFRRSIGFVFQRFHLLGSLGALENVLAPLIPRHPGRVEHDKARALLHEVGLGDRERAVPGELSGGEQQRVAIARALVGDPRLILADEPTGNLDSATGGQVLDLLIRVQRERRATMVIATHDTQIARRCDRVLHLADGHLVDV